MEKEYVNPWGNIWVRPRKAMRSILETNPFRWIIWLALVQGVLSSISGIGFLWTRYPQREIYHHPAALIAGLILGAIFGLFYLYFGGWLLKLTGSWIGGKGSFIEVKAAVGWSFYPSIIGSAVAILGYFAIFHPIMPILFGFLNVLIAVWSFVIYLFLIAEAHRFSFWRALGAGLIAFVLVFAVLMLISLLIPLVAPLFV